MPVFAEKSLTEQSLSVLVQELANRPSPQELECIGEAWRPHKAVAARILWHFYLSEH